MHETQSFRLAGLLPARIGIDRVTRIELVVSSKDQRLLLFVHSNFAVSIGIAFVAVVATAVLLAVGTTLVITIAIVVSLLL